MRTTKEWWNEVSKDDSKMIDWLKKQYHGEVTAEKRIRDLLKAYPTNEDYITRIINKIADDEKKHAEWVKGLLESRGIVAEVLEKEERYWNKTLPKVDEKKSFTYMCAVAHLAERMKVERITLLAGDDRFLDITAVFKKILPDEKYHTSAFKHLSTEKDIAEATENHTNGMNAIGLVA